MHCSLKYSFAYVKFMWSSPHQILAGSEFHESLLWQIRVWRAPFRTVARGGAARCCPWSSLYLLGLIPEVRTKKQRAGSGLGIFSFVFPIIKTGRSFALKLLGHTLILLANWCQPLCARCSEYGLESDPCCPAFEDSTVSCWSQCLEKCFWITIFSLGQRLIF